MEMENKRIRNILIDSKRKEMTQKYQQLVITDQYIYPPVERDIKEIYISQYAIAMLDEYIHTSNEDKIDRKTKLPLPIAFAFVTNQIRLQKYDSAVRIIQNHIDKKGVQNSYLLNYIIAKLFHLSKEHKKSTFYLQNVLKEQPFFNEGIYDLCRDYADHFGRQEQALAILERHLNSNLSNDRYIHSLYIYLCSKNRKKNVKQVLRLMNNKQMTFNNYFNFGIFLKNNEEIQKAEQIFSELISLLSKCKKEQLHLFTSKDQKLLILSKVNLLIIQQQLSKTNIDKSSIVSDISQSILAEHSNHIDSSSINQLSFYANHLTNTLKSDGQSGSLFHPQNYSLKRLKRKYLQQSTQIYQTSPKDKENMHKKSSFNEQYSSLKEYNNKKLRYLLVKQKEINNFFKNLIVKNDKNQQKIKIQFKIKNPNPKNISHNESLMKYAKYALNNDEYQLFDKEFEEKRKMHEFKEKNVEIQSMLAEILQNLCNLRPNTENILPKIKIHHIQSFSKKLETKQKDKQLFIPSKEEIQLQKIEIDSSKKEINQLEKQDHPVKRQIKTSKRQMNNSASSDSSRNLQSDRGINKFRVKLSIGKDGIPRNILKKTTFIKKIDKRPNNADQNSLQTHQTMKSVRYDRSQPSQYQESAYAPQLSKRQSDPQSKNTKHKDVIIENQKDSIIEEDINQSVNQKQQQQRGNGQKYDPMMSSFQLTGFNKQTFTKFNDIKKKKDVSKAEQTPKRRDFFGNFSSKGGSYNEIKQFTVKSEFDKQLQQSYNLQKQQKYDEAMNLYTNMYKKYKKDEQKQKILLKIGNLFQKEEKDEEAEKTYLKCIKFNNVEAFLKLGSMQLRNNRIKSGVENMEKANCIRRSDVEIQNKLIYGYSLREQTMEKALALAHSILKKNPESLQTLILTAKILEKQGKTKEALQIMSALDSHKQTEYIKHYIGILYLADSNLTKAFRYFKAALKVKPDHVPSLIEVATIISEMSPKQAIEILKKVVQIQPGNRKALARLGKIYESIENNFEEAMHTYKQALQSQQNYESYIKIGDCLAKQQGYIEALLNYKQALTLRKTHQVYSKIASMYERKEQNSKAIQYYELAIQQLLKDMVGYNFDIKKDYLISMGKLNIKIGNFDAAITAFQQIEDREETTQTYINLAQAYFGKKQYEAALEYYEKANLLEKGENLEVLQNLAVCFDKLEEYLASKAIYEKILEKSPDNVKCINNLANILLLIGQTNQAFYHFEDLLQKNPKNLEKRLKLADIYAEVGDWSKVQFHLLQCLRLADHDSRVIERLINLYKQKREVKLLAKYQKKLAALTKIRKPKHN